jgi:hypothetical protein
MKIRSLHYHTTLQPVACIRRAAIRLLLLLLLAMGPSIMRAQVGLPDTAILAGPAGSHSGGGPPPVVAAPEAAGRSWRPLLAALADFLFVLGVGVLLHELWRVRRGAANSLLPLLGGVVILALVMAGRAVIQAACRLWVIFFLIGCFGLSVTAASAGTTDSSGSGQPSGAAGLGMGFVLLAQVAADPSFDPIISFLSKVMLLVGGVMIFAGGWKIHKGENSEGLLAIGGGFIVAMAFPIIRYFAGLI